MTNLIFSHLSEVDFEGANTLPDDRDKERARAITYARTLLDDSDTVVGWVMNPSVNLRSTKMFRFEGAIWLYLEDGEVVGIYGGEVALKLTLSH